MRAHPMSTGMAVKRRHRSTNGPSVIEGHVYGSLDAKVAKVEEVLEELAASPARVQSLAGWDWIQDALARTAVQVV